MSMVACYLLVAWFLSADDICSRNDNWVGWHDDARQHCKAVQAAS
ncbi:hypothetical protein [Methylotenera versatilis]|nr:hypothetical protein [Methylotenera versatilis]